MECTKVILFLLVSSPSLMIRSACGSKQKVLTDLRGFKVEGVVGRFAVNSDSLEQEILNRKQQDVVCGQDVKIQLPQSLPPASYNVSSQFEVTLSDFAIADDTLEAELPDDLKELIATSYRIIAVSIPLVIGMTEAHGVINVRLLTNSTQKVMCPYTASISEVTQVDSIEEEDDGTVTVRLGDDVLIYRIHNEVKCKEETKVGKHFDKIAGKAIKVTNYPLPFDWGCELLGPRISFCALLDEFRCEIEAVGGDVCTVTSTTFSERSPTAMEIVKMTGMFREMLPFLAETVPSESFEAERIQRSHKTGIAYPCLIP